jgi:hypothetical protein
MKGLLIPVCVGEGLLFFLCISVRLLHCLFLYILNFVKDFCFAFCVLDPFLHCLFCCSVILDSHT